MQCCAADVLSPLPHYGLGEHVFVEVTEETKTLPGHRRAHVEFTRTASKVGHLLEDANDRWLFLHTINR